MSSSKGIEQISCKKRKCKENVKLATSTNGISTSRFFDMEEQNVFTWMCTTHRQRRLPKSHCSCDTFIIAALLLEILKSVHLASHVPVPRRGLMEVTKSVTLSCRMLWSSKKRNVFLFSLSATVLTFLKE